MPLGKPITYLSTQVGGIYTVIRSKTGVSVNELGDQYILLGPYKEFHARQEVVLLIMRPNLTRGIIFKGRRGGLQSSPPTGADGGWNF